MGFSIIFLVKYIDKGSLIGITGSIQTGSYTNGNKSNSIKSKIAKIIIGILMIIVSIIYFNLSGGNIFYEFFSFIFSCGFGSLLVIYGFVV